VVQSPTDIETPALMQQKQQHGTSVVKASILAVINPVRSSSLGGAFWSVESQREFVCRPC
jgi:hypothetical protein